MSNIFSAPKTIADNAEKELALAAYPLYSLLFK